MALHFYVGDDGSIMRISPDPEIANDIARRSGRSGHVIKLDGLATSVVGTVGTPKRDAAAALARFRRSRDLWRGSQISRIVNGARGTA